MPDDSDRSSDARQIPIHGRTGQSGRGDDVITVDTRRRGPRGPGSRPAGTASRSRTATPGTGGGIPAPPSPAAATAPGRRRRRPGLRGWAAIVVVVVLAWAGSLVWAGVASWDKVHKIDAEPNVSDRPAPGQGHNYLLVGSDSRQGLTKAQRKKFATGNAPGQRTDSIMLIHLSDSGDPTLVSIPRDSYVPIRGYQSNKINASFSFGGPHLLIDTVEQTTGLRIEGFVEIGFGGFASVVDSVGGVRMCLKAPMKDKKAGINLPKGCQVLGGQKALGYVRARYSDPRGDLGRVERQRQFLAALMSKIAKPANVLLPWRLHGIGTSVGDALTIDKNDSMLEVAKVFLAMRAVAAGNGQSVTVPISDPNLQTHAGSAVKWDSAKALALFDALKHDRPLSIKP